MAQVLQNSASRIIADVSIGSTSLYAIGTGSHIRTEMRYSVCGYKTCVHTLKLASRPLFDTLVMPELLGNRTVTFRLGTSTGDQITWKSPEVHRILSCAVAQTGTTDTDNGIAVVLTTADALAFTDMETRTLARQGTLSDILTRITEDYKFSSLVVEPSAHEHSLLQSYCSDYEFMTKRLVTRAINKQQQSNYFLFVEGASLHFHTPGYSAEVWTCDTTAALAPTCNYLDNVVAAQSYGASGYEIIVYDALDGQSTSLRAQPDSARRFGSRKFKFVGTVVNPVHVGQNQASSEYAKAQREYEFARLQAFAQTLTVKGEPGLKIGDLVMLTAATESTSGMYAVSGLYSVLDGEQLVTAARLSRGEASGQIGDSAQGKPVSASTAESGQVARATGSSRTSSGGYAVSVQ